MVFFNNVDFYLPLVANISNELHHMVFQNCGAPPEPSILENHNVTFTKILKKCEGSVPQFWKTTSSGTDRNVEEGNTKAGKS